MSYYSENQFDVVLPYLPGTPGWVVVAGPADANEAQRAARLFPGVRVLGVEPNAEAREWQLANGWPAGHPLLACALWSEAGERTMRIDAGRLRHASFFTGLGQSPVSTARLDDLDRVHGPFTDAVVWLDVEGSELHALLGAVELLRSGRVWLWNVETQDDCPEASERRAGVEALLTLAGYAAVHHWNASPKCRDTVWVKRGIKPW